MKLTLGRIEKYAWFVLAYNIFVIVFGGFVRASGSGAGCGAHWPLCNGVVVPRAPVIETVIEYTHRITSGITVIFVLLLLIWVWKRYPRTHSGRWASAASVFFIFTESLLGAGLVIFNLVDDNDSIIRALSMVAHLVNTFFLLATLALTAWFVTFGSPNAIRRDQVCFFAYAAGVVGMFVLGASGAVTALGDTLFPATSLIEGIQAEFSTAAHYLLRLRLFHPPIAIIVGLYTVWIVRLFHNKYESPYLPRLSKILTLLVLFQLGLGFLNVWLLAPVWLQLIHLLMTTLIWITYVLAGVATRVTSYFVAGVGKK